ncbi:MAG: choice-of-anchor P family protein [Mycobacteriales bacterium]
MSKVAKGLCVGAAAALLGLTTLTGTAAAATPVSGGFADSAGIIVDLTVLTAVPVPGALGNTPIDPNTFAKASQSCPPTAEKASTDSLPSAPAAPAANAAAADAVARSQCTAGDAVSAAAAQTLGLQALFNAGAPIITADVIRAQANSDCTKAPNAAGTQIVGLSIAGTPINGTPAPNTTITIPGVGLSVIINEQHPTADGRGIVVNGLHVVGTGPLLRGDLIVSHAVSGVVCPNGKGSDFTGVPGATPIITFAKDASPSTAKAGSTITYSATVTNRSTANCDVLRFVDHLDPAFNFVSTSGPFGTTPVTPLTKRADDGVDVVLKPTGLILEAGKSLTQTYVVTLKDTVAPGTYYNNLELFCALNGDFASGPLAPVTVPAPAVVVTPAPAPIELPRTGGAPAVAGLAALLLLAAGGARRALR